MNEKFDRLKKRPLPTRGEAFAFAKEMVPPSKWDTIALAEGSTADGGEGLLLAACDDCWIFTYDPYDAPDERGEEKIWVSKDTGAVVKMALEE